MIKFKRFLYLLLQCFLAFIIVFSLDIVFEGQNVFGSSSLYTYFNTGYDGTLQITYEKAQTFTTTSSVVLTSVKARLYRFNSPGTIHVYIRTITDSKPTIGSAISTGSTNANTLTDSSTGEWREIDMTDVTLSASTTYALTMWVDGPNSAYWKVKTTGGFSGGQMFDSADVGAADVWNNGIPAYDAMFEIWGEPPLSAPVISTDNYSNLYFIADIASYHVNLNSTLTNYGGENCSMGFTYRDTSTSNWTDLISQLGTIYITGDNLSWQLWNLLPNKIYEYKAWASNSSGNTTGSSVYIYTTSQSDNPIVVTDAFASYNGTSNTGYFSGYVFFDGNDSLTCDIYVRLKDSSDNWTVTNNTTGLNTDDWFTGVIVDPTLTVLEIGHWYEYKAHGISENQSIEVFGNLAYFYVFIRSMPTVQTLNADNNTNTSINLYGYLTGSGGAINDPTWMDFQYKVSGTSTWYNTTTSVQTNLISDTYQITLTGLQANKTYDYRARAWNLYFSYGYGNINTFNTYASSLYPVVTSDNSSIYADGIIKLSGTLVYTGGTREYGLGTPCSIWFKYRELNGEWIESTPNNSNIDNTSFYITINILYDTTYEWCAIVQNAYTAIPITGLIKQFTINSSDPTVFVPPNITKTWIDSVAKMIGINDLTMGRWAVMALLLMIVAICFLIGIFKSENELRSIIGIIWLCVSIAIVGMFIFTGTLGIWPIVILTCGFVGLIFIIIGRVIISNRSN